VFAEVKVDEQLGVIGVTRVVNAVAAGRLLNPKTAASQVMGGVVWGIGMALHEETLLDHNFGRIMNPEPEHCRISCPGECRRAGYQDNLRQ
jgi:xanthine dehydrogenase YagR molybdenum-binding subunit